MVFPCVSMKMNMRRTPARRDKENDVHEEIPPQVKQVEKAPHGDQDDQVLIVEGGNDVLVVPPKLSNNEIREAFLALVQAVTT